LQPADRTAIQRNRRGFILYYFTHIGIRRGDPHCIIQPCTVLSITILSLQFLHQNPRASGRDRSPREFRTTDGVYDPNFRGEISLRAHKVIRWYLKTTVAYRLGTFRRYIAQYVPNVVGPQENSILYRRHTAQIYRSIIFCIII